MLSTTDYDVERLLKLFTFIPLDEIRLVMKKQLERSIIENGAAPDWHMSSCVWLMDPMLLGRRRIFTNLVPGSAKQWIYPRFYLTWTKKPAFPKETVAESEAMTTILADELKVSFISDLFKVVGLVETKAEGKRLIQAQGAYMGMPSEDETIS